MHFSAFCICHTQAAPAIRGVFVLGSIGFMVFYPVFESFAFFVDMVVEQLYLQVGAIFIFSLFFFFDGAVVRAEVVFALCGGMDALCGFEMDVGGLPVAAVLADGVEQGFCCARFERGAVFECYRGGEQVFFFFDAGKVRQARHQCVGAGADVRRADFGSVERVVWRVVFDFAREEAHQRVEAVDDFFAGFGFVGDFVGEAAGFVVAAGKGGFAKLVFLSQVVVQFCRQGGA